MLRRSLLLALLAAPAAADAPIRQIATQEQMEQFITRHKPRLNKALFFSKLGTATLADKLAAAYAGRLDFGIVKQGAPLVEQFGVTEFPALRVVLSTGERVSEKELNVATYYGDMKFGAFDAISAWLEEGETPIAGEPPEVHALRLPRTDPDDEYPGEELDEYCGREYDTPCLLLLVDGSADKHEALFAELAEMFAGELISPISVDAKAWPRAGKSLSKAAGVKVTSTRPAALFIGPMTKDDGERQWLLRALQDKGRKAKSFTRAGIERFVRSSMSLAAESVEAGEAADGMTTLSRLPMLNKPPKFMVNGKLVGMEEGEDGNWEMKENVLNDDDAQEGDEDVVVVDDGEDDEDEAERAAAKKRKSEKKPEKKEKKKKAVHKLKAKKVGGFVKGKDLTLVGVVSAGCEGCAEAETVLEEAAKALQEAAGEGEAAVPVVQVIPAVPLCTHVSGHISPIYPPFFPVFCAFSPSRRDGSNEPQAGTQGQDNGGRGP